MNNLELISDILIKRGNKYLDDPPEPNKFTEIRHFSTKTGDDKSMRCRYTTWALNVLCDIMGACKRVG